MKKQLTRLLAGLTLVAGLGIFGPARPVHLLAADQCAALGGAIASGECQISSTVTAAGTFNLDETLHILGNGRIDASSAGPAGITLNICKAPAAPSPTCDLIIDSPTVAGGGQIEANDTGVSGNSAKPITINVSRNVLMQAGAAITADNTNDGGRGGDITITAGGDMTLCGPAGLQTGCGGASANSGALIAARNPNTTNNDGGDISITVGSAATVTGAFYLEGGTKTYGAETGATIDATSGVHSGDITIIPGGSYFSEPGSVVQSGGYSVTTNQQGGKIYIVSGCQLTTEGRITSKGEDPGADLIHLEGCEVIVRGLVESTGKGHTVGDIPSEPPYNSCDGNSDGLLNEIVHGDKPLNSTACIEVWGKVITIDSFNHVVPDNQASPLWAGELNADVGDGGASGTSWIDIFAYSKLTVIDGIGNDRKTNNVGPTTPCSDECYLTTYAVHANAMDGSDKSPNKIQAFVDSGPLTASGKTFEASSTLTDVTGHGSVETFTGNGSAGGTIDLQASGTVTLDDAFVNASGDFAGGPPCPSGSGDCGSGGHIIVKAWGTGSDLLWRTGDGNIGTINDSLDPPPPAVTGGDIILQACGQINHSGTNFHGEIPAESNSCSATQPDIPAYPGFFPGYVYKVFNFDAWTLCAASTVSGVKFSDLNMNGVQDQGEPGLSGWTIHLFNVSVHQTQVTGLGGAYTFSGVAPGTYTVCEALQAATPPWQQTYPTSGANCLTTPDPLPDNPTPGKWGYTVELTTGECCSGQQITGKDFGNIQLAIKSGMKWEDVDGDSHRDEGDDPLDGWVIHLYGTAVNSTAVHQVTTTAGGGLYSFTVLPGNYTVCEELQTDWTPTFPTSGANCVTPGDPDNLTPAPFGYAITLDSGEIEPGNDFGNMVTTKPPPPVECPEDPNRALQLTRTVGQSQFDGGAGVAGSPKNYLTIQAAYNAAKIPGGPAEVIGLFANTNENLLLDGSKSLTITQCTVARVTGAPGLPVWNITSTGKLTIIGPDSVGGTIGWRVAGNGYHDLKSVRANGASVQGILVVSSNNSVSWNDVGGNGDNSATAAGIRVEGSTNVLKGGTVGSNKGDGVQLVGGNNTLSGANILSNTGNGVLVSGSTNTVKSNGRINQNIKNGILVTGSNNLLASNTSESSKGNTMNGIQVSSGTGNQLTDNKMNSNKQAGFLLAAGTCSKVKSNANASNTGNEFTIGSGNSDQGGNKKNGTGFTFTTTGGNFN